MALDSLPLRGLSSSTDQQEGKERVTKRKSIYTFVDYGASVLLILYGATAITLMGFVGSAWSTADPELLIVCLRFGSNLVLLAVASVLLFRLLDISSEPDECSRLPRKWFVENVIYIKWTTLIMLLVFYLIQGIAMMGQMMASLQAKIVVHT